ncbi:MAG: MmgE/PrpD family protein [Alphaproteobacteria bacterium]|nr:MmgE/PrpD family protein [Alphaproteobacteria bacterium]
MSATEILARWCAEAPRDWPADCIEGARRAFVDTVAVMLAGCAEPGVKATAAAVEGWGTGSATTIVGGRRLPSPWAALVNGIAAHSQDYDDVLNPAMSHPSAALVPAILALGEEVGASGAACLDAYLVGFEVMTRLGEAMNLVHYHRGWHTTLSLGVSGVAAACGRLLGLDAHAMAMAISLSTSMAGGSKRQFGSDAKPLHAGIAAKNGILAARLAAAGVTGNAEPFEGKWGYVEITSGPEAPGFAGLAERIGRPPAMAQYGVWLKYYPCCASTHRPVDALRALAREHVLRPEAIARIDGLVSPVAAANLRYRVPGNVAEARFSLPYCLAAALLDGTLSPASFDDAAIRRPEVLALIERIGMAVDPVLRADVPVTESIERGTVVVTLADGSRLTRAVDVPHGHPDDPLTAAELDGKFLACAEGALPTAAARRALDALGGVARLNRIDLLTALLH